MTGRTNTKGSAYVPYITTRYLLYSHGLHWNDLSLHEECRSLSPPEPAHRGSYSEDPRLRQRRSSKQDSFHSRSGPIYTVYVWQVQLNTAKTYSGWLAGSR